MTSQDEKDLTEAANLIGEVYGWIHKVNDQEASRLIEALDIIERMFNGCQYPETARATELVEAR